MNKQANKEVLRQQRVWEVKRHINFVIRAPSHMAALIDLFTQAPF